MKYLLTGLIIGVFIGQNIACTIAYYNPRTVDVPVIGECAIPREVANMRGLMETMKLPVLNSIEQREHEIDLIAQLIEGDRP